MELWEIAAAAGLHRIETWDEKNQREIIAVKDEYWQETKTQRTEQLSGYHERRAARDLARKEARRGRKSDG